MENQKALENFLNLSREEVNQAINEMFSDMEKHRNCLTRVNRISYLKTILNKI